MRVSVGALLVSPLLVSCAAVGTTIRMAVLLLLYRLIQNYVFNQFHFYTKWLAWSSPRSLSSFLWPLLTGQPTRKPNK
nr:hypothetical protein Q903MT_gene4963 [Picea sitchensis]